MQGWIFRGTALAVIAVGLAACQTTTGGGGGGGGGGAPNPADFDAAYNRLQGTLPTTDMPTQLNATYTGQARIGLNDSTTGAPNGEAFADLTLNLNWTDTPAANETNVWTGQATNFRGTVNGTAFAATGSLTVDEGLSAVQRTETTLPPPAAGTIATGAYSIAMTGNLTLEGETQVATMGLGGVFVGPGATGMWGPATFGFNTTPSTLGATVGGGTFSAEQ